MTAEELAELYIEQLEAYAARATPPRPEPNAVFVWEELICDRPEEAWPVFEAILARASSDEILEQVWYRLRLLLHRHYDAFHERAAVLLTRQERLSVIAGENALDPAEFTPAPFDREKLIRAYRAMRRTFIGPNEIANMTRADRRRALRIAVEIIHRGAERGWDTFDVHAPLGDVLATAGLKILGDVEEEARRSVAVRRTLWHLRRHLRWRETTLHQEWARFERAAGTTTAYTELDVPVPAPQRLSDADEQFIERWFEHEENFWAFSALDDLCDENPALAWEITLELIDRTTGVELAVVAAGPLEKLIRNHADVIWDDLVNRATQSERFREALCGVWVFPDDEIYDRFTELMSRHFPRA